MKYTVNASGITKSYGSHLVLDQVDLLVPAGSVFALLGPNGAGKTTMVRILATLERPDQGSATVAGHDLIAAPMGVKRSISLTGQFAAIDDLLTGQENLEMMGRLRRLRGKAVRERASELLAMFDLTEARNQRAGSYSGGMKRRLDLAISMIERPDLLFLDEPSTGLDPRSREELWAAVRRLVDDGVTTLLTTQYLEEADQLADVIALLDRGRIVTQGSADELKRGLGAEALRLEFADMVTCDRAREKLGAERVVVACPNALEVATDGTANDLHATLDLLVTGGIPVQRALTHRPSLDDVFFALTSPNHPQIESKEVA